MSPEDQAHAADALSSAILLVEDNEEDILLLRRAFQNARIANPLLDVRDGYDAIQYLAGEGAYGDRSHYPMPFLILLDLRLPKLSGFEVLEWIREQQEFAALIVVVLTGSDHVPDANEAHKLGANSYLVKPDTFQELIQMVKRIEGRWLMADAPPGENALSESPHAA